MGVYVFPVPEKSVFKSLTRIRKSYFLFFIFYFLLFTFYFLLFMKYFYSFSLFIFFLQNLHAQSTNQPAFIHDSLDSYIQKGLKDWNLPGLSVVIVKDGKVVWMKGYGV